MFVSTEPSLSSEIISFDWSNLTESRLHLSVPFQIFVNLLLGRYFALLLMKGLLLVLYPQLLGKALGSPQLVPSIDQILDFN